MPYGTHDWGWGWGIVMMIPFWGLIVALVWVAIRGFTHDGDRREPAQDPKDVLAERFARGEIDAAEYQERLRVLEETRTRTKGR